MSEKTPRARLALCAKSLAIPRQITRLEAERQFRKDEMAKIYASMDTILNLQHSNTAVIDDDSAGVAPRSGASATSRRRGRHSRLPSILDLPSVRAAALLARERGQQDTTELEAEVRELELEVRPMSRGPFGAELRSGFSCHCHIPYRRFLLSACPRWHDTDCAIERLRPRARRCS